MDVVVKQDGPCRKTLQIAIPAEKVSGEFDTVLKSYANSAKIPGFRPGKAPKELVSAKFKKDIEEDVKQRLIPRGYQEALQQEKIDAVAVLGINDVVFNKGESLTFSVTCDVAPDFSPPNYKGIKLKRNKIAVEDKDVEDAIKGILDQRAKFEDVEGRSVVRGDLVQVDFEGTSEGQAIEEIAPKAAGLGKSQDFWVMVDENAFLPEFADALVGTSIGEKKQIDVEFAANFHEAALAGKKATYAVDIKAVRAKILPELDKEILDSLGVASEEELKNKLHADLLARKEEQETGRLKNEIVKHLMDKTKLEIPESIHQEETRNVIYDIVRDSTMRGMSNEQLEAQKSQLFEVASKNAHDKVKSRYILHRIAEDESISLSREELAQRIELMAAGYGVPAEQFRAQLEEKDAMGRLEEDLRFAKVVDFLLEQAKISG